MLIERDPQGAEFEHNIAAVAGLAQRATALGHGALVRECVDRAMQLIDEDPNAIALDIVQGLQRVSDKQLGPVLGVISARLYPAQVELALGQAGALKPSAELAASETAGVGIPASLAAATRILALSSAAHQTPPILRHTTPIGELEAGPGASE